MAKKEIKQESKSEIKKVRYIANARLEINDRIINIGEEIEEFEELRERTKKFLINLKRVKVIKDDLEL